FMDERIGSAPRLGGVRALVVDDSAVIRALLQATLEECGAVVTAVGAADAALEAVVHERPDVIVSDLEMPNKGGYWLIGQVRALSPEHGGLTPAVALTGLVGPEHRASALRAGFQYHLEKPVDVYALVGVVASLARKEPDPRPSLVALPPAACLGRCALIPLVDRYVVGGRYWTRTSDLWHVRSRQTVAPA